MKETLNISGSGSAARGVEAVVEVIGEIAIMIDGLRGNQGLHRRDVVAHLADPIITVVLHPDVS